MAHGDYREELHQHDGHPHAFDTSEPKSSAIAAFGAVTVILLVLIAGAIHFYYTIYKEDQVYSKVLAPEGEQLKALREKESWELNHYGYFDPEKRIVRIPISQARQLFLQEVAENRVKYPTKTYAVKTPEELAAAAAQPAGSTPKAPAQEAAPQPGAGQEGVKQPGTK
jgi:hypothetical protein